MTIYHLPRILGALKWVRGYNWIMKKSEQTKAKLVDAVIKLINKGQKISVASITKEAKTSLAFVCSDFFIIQL